MGLSDKDRKLLWGRARNVCAFPQCRQSLTADQVDAKTGEPFHTVVGEEAHLYSASAIGPRYDPNYPAGKLETYVNRILLCSVHHTFIDSEDGRAYDAETLAKMKQRHEQQEERRERISGAIRAYIADQYGADDRVLFRQVKLDGPSVDSMFVDVPLASRKDTGAGQLLGRIASDHPGDADASDGFVVTGAAQALLHPDWSGNALVVGGPGQGKSTLLQYVCQFHRARQLNASDYTGEAQGLQPLTDVVRVPIRLDLREYAQWSSSKVAPAKSKGRTRRQPDQDWPTLEQFIAMQIAKSSGGHKFSVKDVSTLVSTEPILLALDGLDEVANLEHRDLVSNAIVRTSARLRPDAYNLVVVVATRPGLTKSHLWSSVDFPILYLQKLTAGLRLQYLQRWIKVADVGEESADKLQRTFVEHENLPHIRDLASYPMQLAILLHLLHRRGLLPQQRTELYKEFLKTFLDREETENKEPLLSSERDVIEDIHAFLGWYLQKQTEGGKSSGQIARADLKQLLKEHLDGREKGQELAKQLFSAMESRVLCLIEREPGYFQFEVQSLREYFAAAYINQYSNPRGVGNSRVDCFDALLARPYWLNVCRFFVGMFTKIEVRGIRHSLMDLNAKPELALHPHLRLAAGRLLEDRAYQGQPDAPIQEIVDFVLGDHGVVLADDGFLDESGQPLTFSEDAGRSQVVESLKPRLIDSTVSTGTRKAIARTLRRHVDGSGDLAQWWWGEFQPTDVWLCTAADLGVLSGTSGLRGSLLGQAVSASSVETHWVSEVLERGGYSESADEVLTICKEEINDGAADVLGPPNSTPLGRLVEAARLAQLRPTKTKAGQDGAATRTRFRRAEGRAIVADVVTGTDQIRNRPEATGDATVWSDRLAQVSKLWGNGWLIRQAAALIPATIDVADVARTVVSSDPGLAQVIQREAHLRANRGDSSWWQKDRDAAASELERRAWLHSVLTAAHTQVVLDLAVEIDKVAGALSAKHFRAMEAAVKAFATSSLKRELSVGEALRLGKVKYSARALWLLRLVATEGSVGHIDKKLATGFESLLVPGMGDRRDVMRIVGADKTVKIEMLKGTRDALPAGAWAGDIKLGAMKVVTAKGVLERPDEWPIEIVGRAIQQASGQMNRMPSVTQLAESDKWFQID